MHASSSIRVSAIALALRPQPTLYEGGLPSTRRLELLSAKPLRSGAVAMHYRRALTERSLIAPSSRASAS